MPSIDVFTRDIVQVSEKLSVTGIPLEHNAVNLVANKSRINEEIRGSDGVLFEYFPPELRKAPLFPLKDRFMPFFERIEDMVRENGKTAYAFDPAHGDTYTLVACPVYELVPGLMKNLALYAGVVSMGMGLNMLYEKPTTRRQFFRQAGAGLMGVGLDASIIKFDFLREDFEHLPSPTRLDANFRRAIVAKGIDLLGKEVDEDPEVDTLNLLVTYPQAHWLAIKDLLEDRASLNRHFTAYGTFRHVPFLDKAFFRARQYEYQDKGWVLSNQRVIG